jgi:PAS domain S-box-containing protein
MMETILVVEDDPQSAVLLRDVLQEEGHPVVVAHTGADGRAILHTAPVSLVLLDLRLPDLDGIELLKEAQQLASPPDIVIITGHATLDSAVKAIELGAAGYLLKPIDLTRLRSVVNRLFAQQHLKRENADLYQSVNRERRRLEGLYEVSRRLATVHDADQVLDLIVHEATRLLGVEAAAIRLLEGEELVLRARTESAVPVLSRGRLKVGESLTGLVVLTGEPIAVEDLAEDPRYDPAHKRAALEQGFHAFLSVPLRLHGQIVGTLTVYGKRRRGFLADEISLLSSLGDQTSVAIEKARLLQQEQERRRHLEAVRAVSEEIVRELDLSTVLRLIIQRSADLVGAKAGAVYLWQEAEQSLISRAWVGHEAWIQGLRIALGQGVTGTVAERRQGLIVNDYGTSPYRNPTVPAQSEITAVLAEPLMYQDRLIGVITIDNSGTKRIFSEADRETLGLFATQAAIAIQNACLHEAITRRASHLATLNELSGSLTTTLDPRLVADRILAAAQTLIPDCACRLWRRVVEGEETFLLLGSVGLKNPGAGQYFRYHGGRGLLGIAGATRQAVISTDLFADRRFADAEWAKSEGLLGGVVLPLLHSDGVIGFLSIFTRRPHDFAQEEIDFLTLFGAQAATAIENARLFEEIQAQRMRLAQIFESASDAILTANSRGHIVSWNKAARRIFGYDEGDVVGKPLTLLMPDQYRAAHEGGVGRIEAGAEARVIGKTVELMGLRKDGGEFPIELSLSVWRMAEDTFFTGIIRDITERKQADQMKSDFVSFVTHQLRTPLAGIKWLLELAGQEAGLPAEAGSYIADAREANERLIGLVNDLLDVSRLERGKIVINPKEIDLGTLTQSVLEELHLLVSEKGHRLAFVPDAGVPPVWADPQLLRQVVMNLTSNALKYTPPGGEITIRLSRDGAVVRWEIHDSGIGIPTAAQARLFEKFYRAENVLTIETEGTGLGLYLVRLILDQSQGRVWCESEEGQGATFTFVLPIPPNAESGIRNAE